MAFAQRISPTPACATSPELGTYPTAVAHYPMPSNRYSVQYKLNGGAWTDAKVYISYYGATNSSPFFGFSGFPADTSMSFVSIPALANAGVQLRVTNLWSGPFVASDHVSVRPSVKFIETDLQADGTVQISTHTAADFAGSQFILMWNRDAAHGGAIQGPAFFLDPPYQRPTGSNVRVVTSWNDLNGADLSGYDTVDFEGTVEIGSTGAMAFQAPSNITSIFLGPARGCRESCASCRTARGSNGGFTVPVSWI
jgi:hypothetical protein